MMWRARLTRGVETDRYAAWAPIYPAHAHNALMEVEQAAMLDLLPSPGGLIALDAGCGTGRYARLLVERGAARVIGIDRSPAMLGRVSVRDAARVRGDLVALPLAPASVDLVVSGLAILDIGNLEHVVSEWARVIKPGGVVVYSTLHPTGAKLGWTRTFATGRGTHVLPAYWHTVREQYQACKAAGLSIEAMLEPWLSSAQQPVALVVRARRP
jgi:malonyl-CoA O-methyltransferase